MKITEALKKWAVDNCGVKADATNDEFRKAIADALTSDKLTVEKLQELSKDKGDDEANEFGKKLDAMAAGLDKLADVLTKKEPTDEEKAATEKAAEDKKKADKEKADEEKAAEEKKKVEADKGTPSQMSKMVANMGGTPDDGKDFAFRVKESAERYSDTKSALIYPDRTKRGQPHPKAGRPVMDYDEANGGRALDTPSDRDKAVAGAWAKFECQKARVGGSKTLAWAQLPPHDKELLSYAMDHMDWSGITELAATEGGNRADIINRRLIDREKQALIDDAMVIGSGGFEAVPVVFDDQVISTPLLQGELYPLVNVVPLDRGRMVEGISVGTITGVWGGVDDAAIGLFNTVNYVTNFDTTIYRWQGAIHIGLDFLSDTPINFGAIVTQQYGEALLATLDNVIATGVGGTQPLGIIFSAGTTIAFGLVAATIGGYEQIRFGVSKQEHLPNVAASAVFCGTEVSYRRARAIPVGAADERRLFGQGGMGTEGYGNYSIMGHSYKINNSLTNSQIFYAIMARYRMYRRRGLTIRTSIEGDTLVRANEMLMAVTARYGGQLERAACASMTTTAQLA